MASGANRWSSLTVWVAGLSLVACGEQPAPEERGSDASLATGYWHATISLPGGDIETGIELAEDNGKFSASLVNGRERVRVDDVRFAGGELVLHFPAFNNQIRASLDNGALSGNLTLVKRFGETEVMPFRAVPGGGAAAEDNTAANHDLSGRWAVQFHEPDGNNTPSIGEFAQRGSRLFGTFLNPNGDHRFLAGHVRGDNFHLSTFDGAHAFVFSGTIGAAGDITGADFWSGTSWHQKWSARRNGSVELPDAFSRTYLKPGYERFEFSFPNEEGTEVSLDDEKFQGKVVIVTLNGTWCPNCNDEAAFMAPFHKQYRGRGLEVVSLMFEHFDDPDIAAEQVRRFRAKHGIEFDTLIAGISDKTEAAKALPSLSAVLAFPTTLFIDRGGRVRRIHTGFTGPGTGEHYAQLQKQFNELATELLAEPPALIESIVTDQAEQ